MNKKLKLKIIYKDNNTIKSSNVKNAVEQAKKKRKK